MWGAFSQRIGTCPNPCLSLFLSPLRMAPRSLGCGRCRYRSPSRATGNLTTCKKPASRAGALSKLTTAGPPEFLQGREAHLGRFMAPLKPPEPVKMESRQMRPTPLAPPALASQGSEPLARPGGRPGATDPVPVHGTLAGHVVLDDGPTIFPKSARATPRFHKCTNTPIFKTVGLEL